MTKAISDAEYRQQLHELAEAIREGCKARPRQTFRHLRSGADGACALGAVAAARKLPFRWNAIYDAFPVLETAVNRGRTPGHPCKFDNPDLFEAIVCLNDHVKLTREEIADWLELK